MPTFVQSVLRFVHVLGKLFLLRAHAAAPITRAQEAKLREFMAADPPIWGHGRRP